MAIADYCLISNRVNTISIEITLAPVIQHNVYICYIYQDSDQTTTQQKHNRFIVRIRQGKTMGKFQLVVPIAFSGRNIFDTSLLKLSPSFHYFCNSIAM